MASILFRWRDWGATKGKVTVSPLSWSKEPESWVVPKPISLRVEGEARVDLTPYRGRPAEFTLNPDGLAPSHTFVALIPTDGEVNSVDLVSVDRSSLEPLSGEEALTAAEILAQASSSASDARGYVVASREYAQEASSAASGASSSASEASSSAVTARDASLASQRTSQDSADHASRAAASAALAASSAQGVEDDRLAAERAAQSSLASRDSASASADQAAQSASASSGHAEAAANSADEAARHADSASKADASARAARDEAQASASQLNADAREFGDRVRSGEFKGDEGPANVLSIGTVSTLPPGSKATASISGDSPAQVLNLGLVQGPEGKASTVPGPPGAVATSRDYLIVGPGRPDVPSTTGGVIVSPDTAPVGARYESVDEAGVGARTWRKVAGGKWIVTDGDTGWREITATAVDPAASQPGGRIFIRRLGPALAGIRVLGLAPLSADGVPVVETEWLPQGFRNQGIVMFYLTEIGRGESKGGIAARLPPGAWWKYARPLKINTTAAIDAKGEVVFATTDPWPKSPLPGVPA